MVLRLTRMRPDPAEIDGMDAIGEINETDEIDEIGEIDEAGKTGETAAGSKSGAPQRDAPDDEENGSGEKDGPAIGFGLFGGYEDEDEGKG
jgi:hypothetical protein